MVGPLLSALLFTVLSGACSSDRLAGSEDVSQIAEDVAVPVDTGTDVTDPDEGSFTDSPSEFELDTVDDVPPFDGDVETDVSVVYTYAVKTINYPMNDLLKVLPLLAERSLTLYLNILPKHAGDPDFQEVLAQAKALAVPVKLWPLLYPEDGAWCNEDNIEPFWENIFDLLDYVDTLDHDVQTVVINSELGPPKIDLIHQYFAEEDWGKLIELVTANLDPDRFQQSVARTKERVTALHARGFLAQITTYPYLLEDLLDGDPHLQDAANVVLEGVDWDTAAFTPYRPAYSADFNESFGPWFVYSYAKMAVAAYGDRADIALGRIAPGDSHAYESPEELAADVAAAKAAGIRNIDLFSLPGMLQDDRFDEWADALLVEPAVPLVDEATVQFHQNFELADLALDAITSPE